MTTDLGGFIWYELITPDPAAAERFYGAVTGWTFGDHPGAVEGGSPYRIVAADGEGVAGIMSTPAAAPDMRPAWFGYLHVADVDAAAGQVLAAGGTAPMPPTDILGVGRIAMLTDPQGAAFYVMRPAAAGASRAFAPLEVGHVAWNELATTDLDAGLAFYRQQFGWTEGGRMPMGDAGDYVFLQQGETALGGAMLRANGGPLPAWLFYTHVTDIEGAPDRIRAAGGRVIHGPTPIPGGSAVVAATDPQGAAFGLVGKAS